MSRYENIFMHCRISDISLRCNTVYNLYIQEKKEEQNFFIQFDILFILKMTYMRCTY